MADGSEMPYDLFLGVPVHRVPAVVEESGMTVDGWIPVDPLTLETSFPDVYAVGDVTSVGTPKAGVFAEGQAAVVADAHHRPRPAAATPASTTARGICYLEFGNDEVAKVDVTFVPGQPPAGEFDGAVRRDAWRRQGRVRPQPHPALVRPRLVDLTRSSLGGMDAGWAGNGRP